MHEADPLPLDDEVSGAETNVLEPGRVAVGAGRHRQMREIRADREIDQLPQQLVLATRGKNLEMAETGEGGRDPADDRARFQAWMAVVEHVADDFTAGGDQTQCAGSRHAQVVHGLAAKEFADGGTQHREPVGRARIGCRSGALELQGAMHTIGAPYLAKIDGAAVAELAGPVPELMTAIAGGVRDHARQQPVAGQHLGKHRVCVCLRGQAKIGGHLGGMRQQARRGDFRGRHVRPAGPVDLPGHVAGIGIGRQRLDEAAAEGQVGKAGMTHRVEVRMAESGCRGRIVSLRFSRTAPARPAPSS